MPSSMLWGELAQPPPRRNRPCSVCSTIPTVNWRWLSAWALAHIDPASAEVAEKTLPLLIAGLQGPHAVGASRRRGRLGQFGTCGEGGGSRPPVGRQRQGPVRSGRSRESPGPDSRRPSPGKIDIESSLTRNAGEGRGADGCITFAASPALTLPSPRGRGDRDVFSGIPTACRAS